jgi:hypothetical protein
VSGHTPGPWTYYGDAVCGEVYAVNGRSPESFLVAAARDGSGDRVRANTRLIAAAPDLLAAARAVLACEWMGYGTCCDCERLLASAVEKATGHRDARVLGPVTP